MRRVEAHPPLVLSKTAFGITIDLANLLRLPAEMIDSIAHHLTPHDLVQLSRTCRSLRHVACPTALAAQLYAHHNYDAITIVFKAGVRVFAVYEWLSRRIGYGEETMGIAFRVAAENGNMEALNRLSAKFGSVHYNAYLGLASAGHANKLLDLMEFQRPADDVIEGVMKEAAINNHVNVLAAIDDAYGREIPRTIYHSALAAAVKAEQLDACLFFGRKCHPDSAAVRKLPVVAEAIVIDSIARRQYPVIKTLSTSHFFAKNARK